MPHFTNANQNEFMQRRQGMSCIGIRNRAGDDMIYIGRVPCGEVLSVLDELNAIQGTHKETISAAKNLIASRYGIENAGKGATVTA